MGEKHSRRVDVGEDPREALTLYKQHTLALVYAPFVLPVAGAEPLASEDALLQPFQGERMGWDGI